MKLKDFENIIQRRTINEFYDSLSKQIVYFNIKKKYTSKTIINPDIIGVDYNNRETRTNSEGELITFEKTVAYTDGATIFIEDASPNYLSGIHLHEVGHILLTNFKVLGWLNEIMRNPNAKRVEIGYPIGLMSFHEFIKNLKPKDRVVVREELQRFNNILEDAYINKWLYKFVPGKPSKNLLETYKKDYGNNWKFVFNINADFKGRELLNLIFFDQLYYIPMYDMTEAKNNESFMYYIDEIRPKIIKSYHYNSLQRGINFINLYMELYKEGLLGISEDDSEDKEGQGQGQGQDDDLSYGPNDMDIERKYDDKALKDLKDMIEDMTSEEFEEFLDELLDNSKDDNNSSGNGPSISIPNSGNSENAEESEKNNSNASNNSDASDESNKSEETSALKELQEAIDKKMKDLEDLNEKSLAQNSKEASSIQFDDFVLNEQGYSREDMIRYNGYYVQTKSSVDLYVNQLKQFFNRFGVNTELKGLYSSGRLDLRYAHRPYTGRFTNKIKGKQPNKVNMVLVIDESGSMHNLLSQLKLVAIFLTEFAMQVDLSVSVVGYTSGLIKEYISDSNFDDRYSLVNLDAISGTPTKKAIDYSNKYTNDTFDYNLVFVLTDGYADTEPSSTKSSLINKPNYKYFGVLLDDDKGTQKHLEETFGANMIIDGRNIDNLGDTLAKIVRQHVLPR